MNDLLSTRKRGLKKIVVIFGILVIVFIIFKVLTSTRSNVYPDVRGNIASAKAVKEINREFFFPLKDENGKEVSKIKFLVENAELRDEIVVKGQKATSIKGRTFFIINLKITNEHNSAIEINTRDYLRLAIGDSNEWFAPDIHNDPVEVQAISTKPTRVGFPIDDVRNKFKVQAGEIREKKEVVEFEF
ncbi:hypothetical protein A2691_00610 [Candidatus Woesebacteria bacterium RIFCSPHIGHO2_01_FULL_39_23]|nr:MAG: hypothetical protein A2691_00610 [Candidatus Woesebacteria bacterium RIFCSPHIGHO2_01_FULL_39_23]